MSNNTVISAILNIADQIKSLRERYGGIAVAQHVLRAMSVAEISWEDLKTAMIRIKALGYQTNPEWLKAARLKQQEQQNQ